MDYTVVYLPDAQEDRIHAIKDYNEKSSQRGFLFEIAHDLLVKRIIENPKLFAVKYKGFRAPKIHGYPYCINYFLDDKRKRIVVTGVLHTSRNPQLWDDRIKKSE